MTMTDPNDVRRQFATWFAAECPMTAELANDGDTRAVENRNFAFKGYQAALQSPAVRELVEAAEIAMRQMAHPTSCISVRPTSEWNEHGSISAEGCACDIARVRAALRTLGAGHVE